MLKRVGQVVEEGAGLLEARARVVVQKLQRAGVAAAMSLVVGFLVAGGVLTLLAALSVALAHELGVPAALAITGGILLLLALGVGLSVRAWWRTPDAQEQSLMVEVAAAREAFRKAIEGPEEKPQPGLFDQLGGATGILSGLWKNPAVLAGGAAVVVSLLANGKLLSVVGRLVAVTGMASTVVSAIRQAREMLEEARLVAEAHCNGEAPAEMHDQPRSPGDREVRL